MRKLYTSNCVENVQLSSFPKNYGLSCFKSTLYKAVNEVKSIVIFLFLFVFTENDKKETVK